jgi:hypothetical protein
MVAGQAILLFLAAALGALFKVNIFSLTYDFQNIGNSIALPASLFMIGK